MVLLNIIRKNLLATSALLIVIIGICSLPEVARGKDASKEQIATPASYSASSTARNQIHRLPAALDNKEHAVHDV